MIAAPYLFFGRTFTQLRWSSKLDEKLAHPTYKNRTENQPGFNPSVPLIILDHFSINCRIHMKQHL